MQGLCANLSCQHLGEEVQLVLKTCSLEYYVTILICMIGKINTIATISFQRSCEIHSSRGQEVWSLVHGGEGDTGGLKRKRKKNSFWGSVIATRLNMIKNQMNMKENVVRMWDEPSHDALCWQQKGDLESVLSSLPEELHKCKLRGANIRTFDLQDIWSVVCRWVLWSNGTPSWMLSVWVPSHFSCQHPVLLCLLWLDFLRSFLCSHRINLDIMESVSVMVWA